jgi:hypothetical protein
VEAAEALVAVAAVAAQVVAEEALALVVVAAEAAAQVVAVAAAEARECAAVVAAAQACTAVAAGTGISTAASRVVAVGRSSVGGTTGASGMAPEDGGSGAVSGTHTVWARAGSCRQSVMFGSAAEDRLRRRRSEGPRCRCPSAPVDGLRRRDGRPPSGSDRAARCPTGKVPAADMRVVGQGVRTVVNAARPG